MIGVVRDISAFKQAMNELQRSQAELEQRVQERTRELHKSNLELQSEITKRLEIEVERQQLLRKIVALQEEERRRISRELHDNLGQQLTALRLGIEALVKPGIKQPRKRAEDLREMIKRMDAEVDFLARELRPASLDELGLSTTISNFVAEWSKLFNIPADFHTNNITENHFPPELEINLYRISQEALNNISKHANATHVAVILERRDGHIVLIIEDNGIGFALEKSRTLTSENNGLGLIGMRERGALIGGNVEIESSVGSGTTIFVRVPLPQRDREEE
jgi:two-component system sensor histidine kinase NreB